MNFNKDLISIIIPARTYDFLLEKCIKETENLYPNINFVLILDNVNKEETNKLNKNITILKAENTNMSAKRNQGVNFVNSKYIALIDSDAYPDKNWLELAITFLEKNPNYSAVTGNQLSPPTDTFEQLCLRQVRFSPLFTTNQWVKIIDTSTEEQNCSEFMSSNVIIRRNDYVAINGMNPNIYLAEDNEFSERLVKNGYKIRFIPNVRVFHRESTLFPYLNKTYAIGYYYANSFIKGKKIKGLKESLFQFYPLIAIIIFFITYYILLKLGINPYPLWLLPFLVLCLLINSAYKISRNIEQKRTKAFLFILFVYIMFCSTYVLSTFLGAINFPSKNVKDCYKQY